MKTSELTGAPLDWAVAKCEGYFDIGMASVRDGVADVFYFDPWTPSTDWAQGGPIIEREHIEVRYRVGVDMTAAIDGKSEQTAGYRESQKPMLLAAMRCYVASKLGDEVELPKEITE